MSRLDRRLDLLTGNSPVPRQQTMRAAIDWGYDLLDVPQQELLRRLGVFAHGLAGFRALQDRRGEAAARSALGPAGVAQAYREASATTLDEAVAALLR